MLIKRSNILQLLNQKQFLQNELVLLETKRGHLCKIQYDGSCGSANLINKIVFLEKRKFVDQGVGIFSGTYLSMP